MAVPGPLAVTLAFNNDRLYAPSHQRPWRRPGKGSFCGEDHCEPFAWVPCWHVVLADSGMSRSVSAATAMLLISPGVNESRAMRRSRCAKKGAKRLLVGFASLEFKQFELRQTPHHT